MRKTAAERIEEFERKTRETGGRDAIARMLSRQLEQRFGALSARVRRKLASSSAATLDQWADRFVTAESVEEVFADS
jgi:hypothetical protein